jgi:hypothetical protein
MLALRLRDPGRLGSEGSPGSEPADGRLGSEGVPGTEGRLGTDVVEGRLGRLGSEGVPGTEGRLGTEPADGRLGSDGVLGTDGRLGVEGSPGTEVGSPDGAVTQAVAPLALDALTEPDPAGVVALPPPETVTELGIDGAAGVLMHCVTEDVDAGGTGSEVRLGTDGGATALEVAALGNAFVATAATAATPAAPAASRIIRP